MSARSVLAERDFRLLLAGQTTSQFGTQVSAIAVPLLAVITLRASPLQVGLINAASTVAFLLVGLPAGAWLDRLSQRPIMVISDLVRAALLATIPVAAWTVGVSIPQLLVISFGAGLARVFFDIGYQSYLPSLVGSDRIITANSSMEFLRSAGQVAGPALGGALVSMIGSADVLLVDAGTFAVSALSLLAIRRRQDRPGAASAGANRRPSAGLRQEITEGLIAVARQPVLKGLAVAGAINNFGFAAASAVSVIFMTRVLGLGATQIGLIIAAGSVAVTAGSALTPRLSARIGRRRIIWLSLAVTTPLTVVGALAQPGPLVGLLLLGCIAGEFGQIIYAITSVSLRQGITPTRLLGRVNATMRVVSMALFPLGAVIGGVTGELVGPRPTLLANGILSCLCPLVLFLTLRNPSGSRHQPG